MKIRKKSLAVILVVLTVLLSVCAAFSASAASIKEGTYKKVAKEAYYKISVSGEGYITLYGKSSKSSSSGYSFASMDCELLNSKKEAVTEYSSDCSVYTYTSGKPTESKKIPVSKGTYYIHVESVSSNNGGASYVKYTFKSVKQPTNYCVAKATTLKASTKATVYQTPQYNFDRWYKIKLTKNQKVTISYSSSASGIELYSADGERINLDYSNKTLKSKIKLASGTYYICYKALYDFAHADYSTFSWK